MFTSRPSLSLWCYYIVWRVVHCVDEKDSFTNTSTQDILLRRLRSWNVKSILHILSFFLKCMMTKTCPPLICFSPRGSDAQFVSEVLGCPHIFSHTHRGWHSSPITGGQHLRLSQPEWNVCACIHTSVYLLFDNHMPARPRRHQPDVQVQFDSVRTCCIQVKVDSYRSCRRSIHFTHTHTGSWQTQEKLQITRKSLHANCFRNRVKAHRKIFGFLQTAVQCSRAWLARLDWRLTFSYKGNLVFTFAGLSWRSPPVCETGLDGKDPK